MQTTCKLDRSFLPRALACGLVAAACLLARGSDPLAGVRVEEDEVFFFLGVEEASEVFLVGDFNGWNATVDKMVRVDDVFEINLFLGAGTYQYRFVVDGRTLSDPDNPERSAEGNSVLRLARVGGVLELLPPEAVPATGGVTLPLSFALRFFGQLDDAWEPSPGRDGTSMLAQADVILHLSEADLARVTTQWQRSTFTGLERTDEVVFFSLELGYTVGGWKLTAYDNTERGGPDGPLPLYGDVGIYHFDFGYDVQGADARGSILGAVDLTGLYANRSDSVAAFPLPGLAYLGGWRATGTARDTAFVLSTPAAGGEDVWAFRFGVPVRGVRFGLSLRSDRGSHPTSFVDHAWQDSVSTIEILQGFRDDSRWGLDAATTVGGQTRVSLGFLAGTSTFSPVRRLGYGGADSLLALVLEGEGGEDRDVSESLRLAAALDYASGPLMLGASFHYQEHEPAASGRGGARPIERALLTRAGIDLGSEWRIDLDADWYSFGRERQALFFFSPDSNFWLDPGGELLAPDWWNLAEAKRSLFLRPKLTWTRVLPDSAGEGRDGRWISFENLTAWGDGSTSTITNRVRARWDLGTSLFLEADLQSVSYRGGGLGLEETYASGYLELGLRDPPRWEATIGFGVDPWAYHPTVSRFIDWGRDRFLELRGATGPAGLADYDAFGPIVDRAQRDLESARLVTLLFRLWF